MRGALLPPGSRVELVVTTDGRTLVGDRVHVEPGGALAISSPGRPSRVVAPHQVAGRGHHRFWLGSDRYGRDVTLLILEGGRVSLAVVAASLLVCLVLGIGVGLAAASGGPIVDAALMRCVDALMAFPVLLLLILVSAVVRPGLGVLVVLLGATSWMALARLVRGQVLSLRERPFLQVARVVGTPWYRTWRLHYLPNIAAPVSQDVALRLADLVIAEATLSFLGLGVPPDVPTWGALVAEGQRSPTDGWWLAVLPGVALVCLVLCLALLADGVRETLEDPERAPAEVEAAPALR